MGTVQQSVGPHKTFIGYIERAITATSEIRREAHISRRLAQRRKFVEQCSQSVRQLKYQTRWIVSIDIGILSD